MSGFSGRPSKKTALNAAFKKLTEESDKWESRLKEKPKRILHAAMNFTSSVNGSRKHKKT